MGTPPAPGTKISVTRYRVPFYDTDAMRIVHHANFVRYLELARLRFLEEHLEPYSAFVARGLHFAVTRCEVDFRAPARFDEALEIRCWLRFARGASLGIAYRIERDGALLADARTEHAMVDDSGRPVRIPAPQRDALRALVAPGASSPLPPGEV